MPKTWVDAWYVHAMKILMAKTRMAFERKAYYLKIHELVVREHEQIAAMLARYDLILPDMPPKEKVFVEVS